MRLPSEAQLSMEQKAVCYAPTKDATLVIGPPGSGKTVVAIFRQNALMNRDETVTAVAYNRVLSKYAGLGKTFHSWIGTWWRKISRSNFPSLGGYNLDYPRAIELIRSDLRESVVQRGNWHHLIIDEAQDFAPAAHQLFNFTMSLFMAAPESSRPSILVLADENQRLNEHANSKISEIADAYLLGDEDIYKLTMNYRNTREIAELSRKFFTGLQSGVPELPQRRGDKPRLFETEDLNDAVKRIVRYAKMNEEEEIGVLVRHIPTRKKLFNKLKAQLKDSKIRVRTYSSSRNDPNNDISNLIFDDRSVLTVLNYASSKGLEFDTVFLPELQENKFDAGNDIEFKMNLYVMTSRARTRLFLMISDQERVSPVRKFLPLDEGLLDV